VAYRITVRSNPRLLVIPVLVVGLLGLALAAFTAGPLLGIVAVAFAGYIAYALVRFVRKQLACVVDVLEDTLVLDLYGEEKIAVAWRDLTHLGVARDGRKRRVLFLYREPEDKLLVVPDEFESFDNLVAEVAEKTRASGHRTPEGSGDPSAGPDTAAWLEIELGVGETLKDRLRTVVGGRGPVTPPS
jgi:hypothetical protein